MCVCVCVCVCVCLCVCVCICVCVYVCVCVLNVSGGHVVERGSNYIDRYIPELISFNTFIAFDNTIGAKFSQILAYMNVLYEKIILQSYVINHYPFHYVLYISQQIHY